LKKRVRFIELFKTIAIILCIVSGAILLISTCLTRTTPDIFFTQNKISVLVIFILFLAANLYVGRKILITGLSIITITILVLAMSSFLTSSLIIVFQLSDKDYFYAFFISFGLSMIWQTYLLDVRKNALKQIE